MTTRKYVPIDRQGYRIPVSEWTRKDRITFDGALPRGAQDETDLDPEGTNSGYTMPDPRNKPREFAVGSLKNSYASEPPEGEDEDDDEELPEELVGALLKYAGTNLGVGETLLKQLHGKLSARNQAEDDDCPPDMAGGGRPNRGGGMTALKASRQTIGNEKAMDSKRSGMASFAERHPNAARISGAAFRRDRVPPGLALDRSGKAAKSGSAKSFADRHPDAARIRFSY
jgi:hypothetical protein